MSAICRGVAPLLILSSVLPRFISGGELQPPADAAAATVPGATQSGPAPLGKQLGPSFKMWTVPSDGGGQPRTIRGISTAWAGHRR